MASFANLFRRGPRVGAPVATPTAGNLNYPHAPIIIQPPQAAGPQEGDPSQTIYRMLEEIRSFPVGAQFFIYLNPGPGVVTRISFDSHKEIVRRTIPAASRRAIPRTGSAASSIH